jgi:chaperone modulatory protein CbpM
MSTDRLPPATSVSDTAETVDRLDDLWLDLDTLCRAAGVAPPWVQQRAAEGLIDARPLGPGNAWRFDSLSVRRVRCMARVERDFDAVPELAALVADLEDEIQRLRRRLRALGLD